VETSEAYTARPTDPGPTEDPRQDFFTPILTLETVLPPHARPFDPNPVRLETTGVIGQKEQRELFNRALLYKASVAAKLREVGCLDLADVLSACHATQSWAQCDGCKSVRTFWNRCDNSWCPACQPRLTRERSDSIKFWCNEVGQPKHVVLTWRNTDTITFALIKQRKAALKRLLHRKLCRAWRGGFWSLEFTKEDKGWHGHFHLLVDADWIDKPALAIQWGELVGQDFAIVHASDCRGQDYLREVNKYAVKGSELSKWSGHEIAHFVHSIQGQRLFGVFGSLHGKRTQWAEWLAGQREHGKACECGCTKWTIYDADAWQIHQRRAAILSGTLSLPPPKSAPRSLELAF